MRPYMVFNENGFAIAGPFRTFSEANTNAYYLRGCVGDARHNFVHMPEADHRWMKNRWGNKGKRRGKQSGS